MPQALTNYHPDQVVLSFMGVTFRGYAEGTFIEIEREEDGLIDYTGSLGEVCRTKNLNLVGEVVVTLMASSPVNDLLTAIALADQQSGLNYGPLICKDLNGTMRCFSPEAWIKK